MIKGETVPVPGWNTIMFQEDVPMKKVMTAACTAVLAAVLLTGCSGGKQGGGSYSMQNFSYTVGENIVIDTANLVQYSFKEKRRSDLKFEITDFGKQYVTPQYYESFCRAVFADRIYEDISVSLEERSGIELFYANASEQLGGKSVQHRVVIAGCEGCILQIEASFPEDKTDQWQQELDTILESLSFTGDPLEEPAYENAAVSVEAGIGWHIQYADDERIILEKSAAKNPCERMAEIELEILENVTQEEALRTAAEELGVQGASQSAEFRGIPAESITAVTEESDHSTEETIYIFEQNGYLCRADVFFCRDDAGMEEALSSVHIGAPKA